MGIKKNFIFSSILTVSNYIFPFIVYPYVARVLGVTNMGICNYVDGIVNYAMMISLMGISVIGVREIAKTKCYRESLDITFTSLITLCTIFTLFSTIALVTATLTLPKLQPYRPLLWIGVLKLWSNFLLLDWFYRGLEDFKYITKRTIIVKMVYVVCIFLMVHTKSDYIIYYLLTCLVITVNSAINCWRAAHIVSLRLSVDSIKMLTRPFLILGAYILLNSFYLTFNVIYLGWICNDTEVGYYTTATKLFQLILAFYTAYSGVIMPRASAMLAENRIEEFKVIIKKSIDALFMFGVPAMLFSIMFSKGIILLIAGEGYEGAVLPMMIVMPLILVIGYEQILVVQILTPMSNDRAIFTNSIIGALTGIIANIILVPILQAVGSAIVWVAAEIAVLLSAQFFVTRLLGIRFPINMLLRNIIVYIPYVLLSVYIIHLMRDNHVVAMFIGAVICVVYFLVVQTFVLKSQVYISIVGGFSKKIFKK